MPADTLVTTPVADTVASLVFDDCHAAVDVTSCRVPSVIVAVAVNCEDAPTAGAAPVMAMELTVEGEVFDFEHARDDTASPTITTAAVPR